MKTSNGSCRKSTKFQWLLLAVVALSTKFTFVTSFQHHVNYKNVNPRIRYHADKLSAKESYLCCFEPSMERKSVLYSSSKQTENDNNNNNNNDNINDNDFLFGFPRETVGNPLLILLLSQFLLFIGVGAVIPSIPLYGKEIGLSSAANGIVISAPAVALLIGAKFGGNFADMARKPAMLYGMAIIAVSDIGTALAQALPALIVARLGLGLGRCISESGERGMLADLAGQVPELRGRALAAQQAVIALGIAIGAPLGGIVVEEYGPRAAFLCVSAAAIVALLFYTILPETIELKEQQQQQEVQSITTNASTTTTTTTTTTTLSPSSSTNNNNNNIQNQIDWKDLIAQNRWKGLALCQCGASVGFASKIACIPVLATDILPGGAAGAGVLLSAAGLSGLLGAPIGGWLTDQFSAKTTIIVSGIISGIGLICIPLALSMDGTSTFNDLFLMANNNNLALGGGGGGIGGDGTNTSTMPLSLAAVLFSLATLTWSIGAAAQGPALSALAQEMAPPRSEATAMALPRAAGDGTYIVTPFLLGLVADTPGLPQGTNCAIAGLALLLGVMALIGLGGENQNNNKRDG